MSASSQDDKSTASAPKTKQERIRDNQRRSRARRQEYLGDLEKRMSECQLTCREADIQRAAFLELQIENGRLRGLLSLAGVNDDFVEHYVSQAVSQAGQYPHEANPSLRQIKPKLNSIDATRNLSTKQMSISPTIRAPINIKTHVLNNNAPSPRDARSSISGASTTSTFTPTTNYTTAPISAISTSFPNNVDWMYQHQPQSVSSSSLDSNDGIICQSFGCTSRGPTRAADDNSVLCTVAKQMIDQYFLAPDEMYEMKAKLAEGFCRPAFPGGDCAVDNQKLFEVLNELSMR
ncbi:hypothetical protein LTR66_016880, partial [Elasticomyces elasticus]